MAVSRAPLDVAAHAVVAAAMEYVDLPDDEPIGRDGKDLYHDLVATIRAYREIERSESASADRTVEWP